MLFTDADLLVPLEPLPSERRAWNKREATGLKEKNTYIGQAKLLAGEIAFVVLGIPPDLSKYVIVYAGAAGGHHIPALALLVPETKFYLYDPAPFAIEPSDQLTIINGMFTDEVAQEWAEHEEPVVFISDVRTSGDTAEEHESEVNANMAMQARWIEILRPNLVAFSLKFRIPYPIIEADLPFAYLDGKLIYQPFAKPDSMELRLIGSQADAAKGPEGKIYDSKALEQAVFYHNSVIRPNLGRYLNVFTGDKRKYPGGQFNGGYDCTYLLYCIKRHLETTDQESEDPVALAEKLIAITSQGRWTLAQRQARR